MFVEGMTNVGGMGRKKKHGVLLVYYLGDGFMHAKPQMYIYIHIYTYYTYVEVYYQKPTV